MDASTYLANQPDVDLATLAPQDQTCSICHIGFESTPTPDTDSDTDSDAESGSGPENAVRLG